MVDEISTMSQKIVRTLDEKEQEFEPKVHQINNSLRNMDFPLYQDLLLIITNEPIFTLHIARLFSSLISSSRALDMIISWVVSPTTLSNFDFTGSILSRLFTSSLMGPYLQSIALVLT